MALLRSGNLLLRPAFDRDLQCERSASRILDGNSHGRLPVPMPAERKPLAAGWRKSVIALSFDQLALHDRSASLVFVQSAELRASLGHIFRHREHAADPDLWTRCDGLRYG